MEKKCFKCGKIKPLSEFYKHKQMSDGHVNKCKECNKTDVQENYQKNKTYYKLYDLQRNRERKEYIRKKNKAYLELNKEKIIKNKAKWAKENKHKVGAQIKVRLAIKSGTIKKEPCEICGKLKVEAHHKDYTKPLDVTWLCNKHHNEEHVRMREAELIIQLELDKEQNNSILVRSER